MQLFHPEQRLLWQRHRLRVEQEPSGGERVGQPAVVNVERSHAPEEAEELGEPSTLGDVAPDDSAAVRVRLGTLHRVTVSRERELDSRSV